MKVVIGAFNHEKVLVGASSEIVKSSQTFVYSSNRYMKRSVMTNSTDCPLGSDKAASDDI